MKRVADKQLSKDDQDAEDDNEDVGTGFKKADESVLASRPIRGLPKRSSTATSSASATPPPAAAASEAAPAPGKFSGFTGFGSSATSSTPFSFGAPSATSKPAAPASSSSPFSFSGTTSSQPSSLFGTTVSSNASPATKAFASIVSSSSTPTPSTAPAPTETPEKADEKDIEYFKALRGLNVSLLSAISKTIEADPFVDVADLLERYKALRVTVDSEKPKTSSDAPANASTSLGSAPKPAEGSAKPPASTPSFTMPAPPSGFSGFKPLASSSATTSSSSGAGFTPKVDSGSSSSLGSPFSFSTSKPAGSEPAASEPPKSSFSFNPSSFSSTTSSTAPAPFSFGTSTSGSSLFSKPDTSTTSSTPSFFSQTSLPASASGVEKVLFNSFHPAAKAKAKEADKSDEKDPAPAPSTSSSSGSMFFGSSTSGSNPFVTSTPEKTSPATSSAFSFGSASPSKGSSFFGGFPKAGSIGNPVGFGFGSPPKTPEAESADGPVKSLPFAFGAPKPAPSSTEEKKETEDGSSGDGTPAPEPANLPAGTSVHDLEGEGEEQEVTTHEVRSKVYKMTKDKDGKAQWGDMGVGVLRLKKHKETESRRMLLRNSSTGKITINFILYTGLSASVADKVVSFIGHDDGQSTPYRIRCKTAAQANELKAALDREIEFVKAKSEAS